LQERQEQVEKLDAKIAEKELKVGKDFEGLLQRSCSHNGS
jgi:hypothetical protein